eukprot:m.163484 g.163484  ORF g.163484 m.163484 type:complete len:227 (-) comp15219_c0_seq10:2918-3598(-)
MVALEQELSHKNQPAYIEAFYPGMEGAMALAKSIFGQVNKFGRMPYTVYHADWIQNNSMRDHDVTHKRTYRYGADALIPFGTGLSLTEFSVTLGSVSGNSLPAGSKESITISVSVKNSGHMTGDEVLMLYMSPKNIDLPQVPVKSLIDFQRVHDLSAGDSRTVSFTVTSESLLLVDGNGNLVSATGEYSLTIEDGDLAKSGVSTNIQVTGTTVIVDKFPAPKNKTN